MTTSKGVIYIAINKPWTKEAIYSAKSVKKYCKGVSTTLFTNCMVESKYIDNVKIYESLTGKRFKFDYLDKSPYDYSLYLDSDTEIRYDISELFTILDKFDIALRHNMARASGITINLGKKHSGIPYSFPGFNGGVILFRKTEKVEKFIKLWRELYYKYKKEFGETKDQPSLRVALWESDLKIYSLPLEYNLPSVSKRINKFKNIKARIIHGRKLYNKKNMIKKSFKMISFS